MEDDTFKKALGEIKNIHLSSDEKSFVLESILHKGIKSPYWSPYAFVERVYQSKLYAASLAAALLVTGGGSMVLAAEDTVPGDILYPIKVSVTEPMLDRLYVTASESARWQGEKTVRRLREAETLALQGKLDVEKSKVIEEKIQKYGEQFHATISDISTTTEAETREEVEIEYESKVRAHAKILNKIEDGYMEEAKATVQSVAQTLDKELQKNKVREEERGKEKKGKAKVRSEITKKELNQKLRDTQKSLETVTENIKKEQVNLSDFGKAISAEMLEESGRIIEAAAGKLRESKELGSSTEDEDVDEEKTISDIEDSEKRVFEMNTMFEEVRRVGRHGRSRTQSVRE